jgi:hypothetical protein
VVGSALLRPMCWPKSAPSTACCVYGKRCVPRSTVSQWLLQIGYVFIATHSGWNALAHASKKRVRLWGKPSGSRLRGLIGRQGTELLDALFDPTAPQWLRQVPAVEVLRHVWVQHYQRIDAVVRWRSSENIPPPSRSIGSPQVGWGCAGCLLSRRAAETAFSPSALQGRASGRKSPKGLANNAYPSNTPPYSAPMKTTATMANFPC